MCIFEEKQYKTGNLSEAPVITTGQALQRIVQLNKY
jgi:hypothetical protein